MAKIDTKKYAWNFIAHIASNKPKNVPSLIDEFKKENNFDKRIELAWNGGYILNPELVGKLGLSETYIGSPLGLLIINGKIACPPLFNKPAFIIYKNGEVDIQLVNSSNGFNIIGKESEMKFSPTNYNIHSSTDPCYYDLSYTQKTIKGDGNIIVRIAGNR